MGVYIGVPDFGKVPYQQHMSRTLPCGAPTVKHHSATLSCSSCPHSSFVVGIISKRSSPRIRTKAPARSLLSLSSGLDAGTQGSRPLEACRQIPLNVGTTWGGPTVWAALIAPNILTLPDVRHREPTASVPMSREPRRPKTWST